jgi:hypothetical protein
MEKLWSSYVSGNLPLSITMKKAYSEAYNIKLDWLCMTEETVGDFIQRMLSELQSSGYDLDVTDMEVLQEKFISEKVIINTPVPYTELSDALVKIKEQIKESISSDYPENVVATLQEIKEKIELQLAIMG